MHMHTHIYTHAPIHVYGERTLKFLMLYYCLADFLYGLSSGLSNSVFPKLLKLLYPLAPLLDCLVPINDATITTVSTLSTWNYLGNVFVLFCFLCVKLMPLICRL